MAVSVSDEYNRRCRGAECNNDAGRSFSHVLTVRSSQAFILGRYCTHFHMASSQEDGYVTDNSIHHGYQRAVTVHATSYAMVSNNVAYNIRGHTFFVEDGNEKFNVFDANLAVNTLCSAVRDRSQGICETVYSHLADLEVDNGGMNKACARGRHRCNAVG